MMFKKLIDAFRKSDVLGEMVQQFGEMLDASLWMFQTACDVVEKSSDGESVREELYRRDKKINQLEFSIRERLVVHLATNTDVAADVGMSLVLMSVVKDAERTGDYCKNLFEIGKFFRSEYNRKEYAEPLKEIRESIAGMYPVVKKAFVEVNTKTAEQATEECFAIRQRCDLLIRQLLTPGFPGTADEAVAYALRTRFFKRVASHLGNIVTSVNNPVPMLDFRKGKPLDEPDDV